jgi:hypothetical protein
MITVDVKPSISSSFIRFITRITGSDKEVRATHYYHWKRQYYHHLYRWLTTGLITKEAFRGDSERLGPTADRGAAAAGAIS